MVHRFIKANLFKRDYKVVYKEYRFIEKPSKVINITLALDIIKSRLADPTYFKFYKLAKIT